jgi:lipoate-protein ligase A
VAGDFSTPLEMTKHIFDTLDVYHDDTPRTAAINMAIDEAILEIANAPSLRLYRWDHPALSFGYFGRYVDVSSYESECDLVRRWTGGGIVFHGEDLTYSIIIPRNDPSFANTSMSVYALVHSAVRDALIANDESAELASVAGVVDAGAAVTGRDYNAHSCFANPVRADVLVNGQKVAGAAQRKTRAGLLQQGSIQHVDLAQDFGIQLAARLADGCQHRQLNGSIVERAHQIAGQKYGTTAWLQRR